MGIIKTTNHINPNPSKEVSQWVLWLDRQSSIYGGNRAIGQILLHTLMSRPVPMPRLEPIIS